VTSPEQAVLVSILVCLAGAGAAIALSRHRTVVGVLSFVTTLASAGLVCYAAASVLILGSGEPAIFWAVPHLGFALRLHVDGLTAVFLILAAVVAVPSALYSIAYLDRHPHRSVALYYPYFLLFLAAMYGLVSTTDVMWFFFIFWQLMTLPGYALIRFEKDKPDHRRAANKYLLMMQFACVVTMIGAELLAVGGASAAQNHLKYDIQSISQNLPSLLQQQPGIVTLAFTLFLVGFGIKMGMWPFGQLWLPDAHPAAPSPVSAMLSGVMIKTGVYGLIRYFLWLVPLDARHSYPLSTWGFVVALLGTVTLLTGTWQALQQTQSKRLLAFHSIGQIGYILLGTGVCMILLPSDRPDSLNLATLALFGALFHTFNHGVFKALLFLNAGSLLHATHTQDLNKMGGLLRYLPWTAATALIASLSISGLPLLNGFPSKWSIYVATIQGSSHAPFLAICAILALLTAGLTLASFVKFFGTAFLSSHSTLNTRHSKLQAPLEVPWSMRIPQLFLAALCIILGLLPFLATRTMHAALDASPHSFGLLMANTAPLIATPWSGIVTWNGQALFMPVALLITLATLFAASLALVLVAPGISRTALPWLCGYVTPIEAHRYSARHFYNDLKHITSRRQPPPHHPIKPPNRTAP
jgi:hydrogenase-4 component B